MYKVGAEPKGMVFESLKTDWYGFCQPCNRFDSNNQGWVARSMVSANHWLRGIKTYRLSWYLTRVSANHASSNWAQVFFF